MTPFFTLANQIKLPQIGFGTYRAADDNGTAAICAALSAGYRYFDTASFYGTEAALADAIMQSNIPRAQCQIASKLWKDQMGYDNTLRACEESLTKLQTEYLDVYLIHWPRPDLSCDWRTLDQETWRAMERLYQQGLVKAIGVSNFLVEHLENLSLTANLPPMINQLEFHPGYTQLDTVQYCLEHDILPQAWSPIGRARMLNHTVLVTLADKYAVTPAQICLRFAIDCGVMPLPKSINPERIAQNYDVFGFTLSPEDKQAILDMPLAGWSGEHPDRERAAAMQG